MPYRRHDTKLFSQFFHLRVFSYYWNTVIKTRELIAGFDNKMGRVRVELTGPLRTTDLQSAPAPYGTTCPWIVKISILVYPILLSRNYGGIQTNDCIPHLLPKPEAGFEPRTTICTVLRTSRIVQIEWRGGPATCCLSRPFIAGGVIRTPGQCFTKALLYHWATPARKGRDPASLCKTVTPCPVPILLHPYNMSA